MTADAPAPAVALDSSCWIAWLDAGDGHADRVDDVVEAHDGRILVPTIVVYEVARWLRRTGLASDQVDAVISRLTREASQAVTQAVALRGSELTARHGLATADALIAASADIAGCRLATFDTDFAGVPNVLVLT